MLRLEAAVCALPNITQSIISEPKITMLIIRVYISALTFLFLLLVITNRGLGILEAIVTSCAIVYLILDVRTDLQVRKTELRLLQDLEKQLSALLR